MGKLFYGLYQFQFIFLPIVSFVAYASLMMSGQAAEASDGFLFFSTLVGLFVWVLGMIYSSSIPYRGNHAMLFLMCLDSPLLLLLMYLLTDTGLNFPTYLVLYFLLEVNALLAYLLIRHSGIILVFFRHKKEENHLFLFYLILCFSLINFTALGLYGYEALLQIGLLGQLLYGFALFLGAYFYSQAQR